MIGEFSFPSNYDDQRGFGSWAVSAESDTAAGAMYAQWLQDTSACTYCIGVSWFEYGDEPVSGRGPEGSTIGTALVYGENFAFGLMDGTDQPKYDLVNQVRAANIAALQNLGLLAPTPVLTAAAVVNAASYQGGSVSPGEMVTLFVGNVGPSTLASAQLDAAGKLATETGGTRVLFDGYPSPMVYAVAGQVAAVVPFEVAGEAATQAQVEYQGVQSLPVRIPVTAAVPGVFTGDASGKGQAAMLNQDGSANSPVNPAAAGSVCVMYITGAGQTNPPGVDGQLANFPTLAAYPRPVLQVSVTLGGVPASVQYAGAAPTFVAGFLQINFQVPAGLTPGAQIPIAVKVGDIAAPLVTMAVK
jgi:uncharacterized protein (TIGR03437 family)